MRRPMISLFFLGFLLLPIVAAARAQGGDPVSTTVFHDGHTVHGAALLPLAVIAQDTRRTWVVADNLPQSDSGSGWFEPVAGQPGLVRSVIWYRGVLKIKACLTAGGTSADFPYSWAGDEPAIRSGNRLSFQYLVFGGPGAGMASPGTFVCRVDQAQQGKGLYPPDINYPDWFMIPDGWSEDVLPALKAVRSSPDLFEIPMPSVSQARVTKATRRLREKFLNSRNPWLSIAACRVLTSQGALDAASVEGLLTNADGVRQGELTYVLLRNAASTQQSMLEQAIGAVITRARASHELDGIALGVYVALSDADPAPTPMVTQLCADLLQKQKSLRPGGLPDVYLNTVLSAISADLELQ